MVRVAGLCETFLLDAAVLVFVFPALDTLINFGAQKLTFRLILWTPQFQVYSLLVRFS
jgi:hypothetical protein